MAESTPLAHADRLSEQEENDVLRALLHGLCQTSLQSLSRLGDYLELVADSADQNGTGTLSREYLGQADNLQQEACRRLQTIRKELPPQAGCERLNLRALMRGVADRYRKILPGQRQVELAIPDSLYAFGNPFCLQKTAYEIMEEYERRFGQSSWEIRASAQPLQSGALDAMGSGCKQGNYCWLWLGRPGYAWQNPGSLTAHVQAWEEAGLPLWQGLQWAGTALAHQGTLLLDLADCRAGVGLLLPVYESRHDDDAVFHASPLAGPASGKTILLVDDEDMIWDVITDMLQGLGYHVILAGDGQEAVDIYRANAEAIDLVILDMLMPNMNGQDAFTILRTINPRAKVLLSSGYVSDTSIQDVLRAGASGFLRKPYRMTQLAEVIQNILAEEEKRRET